MSRVDINAIDAGNIVGRVILEVKRIKESTLAEVQSIHFVTGSGDDRVT